MRRRAITAPNHSHPGFVTTGAPAPPSMASAAIAGLCASLMGIGLARFAYAFGFAHSGQVYVARFAAGAVATALAFVVGCAGGRNRPNYAGQVGP